MIQTMNTSNIEPETEGGIHPKKFLLWLLIVASVMLFAAFTSAYIVRRGEGNWLLFELPKMFGYNTVIVLLSSFFMQLSVYFAKKDELSKLKISLYATLVTGIIFSVFQYLGWKELIANNVYLAGNPSESFVYVISAVHLVHILIGLVFIGVVIIKAYLYRVHKTNLLSIQLCTTYWHFVGALWIYLYFFLLLNR